jgi:hypothetical protein
MTEVVRTSTVADIVFRYKGEDYTYRHDFENILEEGLARYMFFEGNYSCD